MSNETFLLIQVIEETLKPLLAKTKQQSQDIINLLTCGYNFPLSQLFNLYCPDPNSKNLRNSYILTNSLEDLNFCRTNLEKIHTVYDELITALPAFSQAIDNSFFDILEALGSSYESFSDSCHLFESIKALKEKKVDISSLLTSIYTHYTTVSQKKQCKIREDLTLFAELEEVVKTEIYGQVLGLSNENTKARVIDLVFDFIENEINFLEIVSDKKQVGIDQFPNSRRLLKLIEHLGEVTDYNKERLDSITELGVLPSEEARIENLELESPEMGTKLNVEVESQTLYAYSHNEFYVEVRKGLYNGKKIVVKKYEELDGKIWDPSSFSREIQILYNCDKYANEDSCFLKFYGAFVGTDPSTKRKLVLIYLEYMETDLQKRIEELKGTRRSFTEEELEIITSKLIRSFATLQSKRITHQDIKPANILIADSGRNVSVKIIDFSVSKFSLFGMPTTQSARVQTTLDYRAPEIFGQSHAAFNSFNTDTYSLGLVFYEMYTLSNIVGLNTPQRQNELELKIRDIQVNWLKNLLYFMLIRRGTFKECLAYLKGGVTGET